MKLKLVILLLMSFSLCYCQKGDVFKPTFQASEQTTHNIRKGQEYTFGYLEVKENRNNPTSGMIKIPVYIFKSRNPNPKPDPIIYTVGGPGSSTMPSAQYMNYYKYLDDRDFILVEQRGNYYAKPHLDCPEWSKAVYQSNLPDFDSTKSDRLFEQAAIACRDRLSAKGIDLNGYNTNEIAADIHDLVEVLGIEKYNLLTISYSTKIAQVLLRDFPDGIRSVVMDSPLPLEVSYDEESVGNLMAAVDKLLSDCENQEKCNEAYPDLKKRFHNFLIKVTGTPLEIEIKNPINGNLEVFNLKGEDIITVFTAASTGNISEVPFEINKLLNGDLSSVDENLTDLFDKPSGGTGIGMRLSVWCSEEFPFNDEEIINTETYKYPEVSGLSPAVFDSEICKIWGVKPASPLENQAVLSDIPVLLISGEYDNETPPKWAINMRKNLKNSHHLIFKGWKHTPTTNWGNQCAMQAANDFFNNPGVKPHPDCFKKIGRPEFKTE
ncbi:MAG: alpha/beta fold hydrolase [Flavobacteriaceae bacterium]|nr:alpha/beta fold hydrolase [Flavobacteriaceae bacterium]